VVDPVLGIHIFDSGSSLGILHRLEDSRTGEFDLVLEFGNNLLLRTGNTSLYKVRHIPATMRRIKVDIGKDTDLK
jgi:hypothetical protein